MTPQEIISDEEIERVHANARFGSMSKRRVVNHGVLQAALGYSMGSTMLSILVAHGLARKPRPSSNTVTLSAWGKRYLRAMIGETRIDVILNILGVD